MSIENREGLKESIAYKQNNFRDGNFIKLEDFFIKNYRIIETRENIITLSTIIVANLVVKGRINYSYETYSSDLWLESTFNFILDTGIHNFKISDIKECNY